MSIIETISTKINAHNTDINKISYGTLVASHNAILAVYVGSPLAYNSLHSDITYNRKKPSENSRRLLYVKLSKAYDKFKNNKIHDTKNHNLEDISKLIDCAIYDSFHNYEREKKKIGIDKRFIIFPKVRVSKLTKIPSTTFDRKYYRTYVDFVDIIHSGLKQIDYNAKKMLKNDTKY